MVVGGILMFFAVLIALFPELLSYIVAFLIFSAGLSTFLVSYRFKKMNRTFDNPFIDFFIKF
jgi:Flp pilus assembly protein TadB